MKQEELFKTLIKELFLLSELHLEYQDQDMHYAIDSRKQGNTLTIVVTLKENRDKKEFERWCNNLSDDIFSEVWDSLSKEDNLHSLDELYRSDNYKEVIRKFKNKTREIASNKIKELQKLL